MGDYLPAFANGIKPMSLTASATITGGQVVIVSGVGTVAPSGAASGVVAGVAAHDAANGARVSVWPIPGLIHEVVCTAGASAGASLASSTAGTVDSGTLGTLAAAGTLIGTALTTAAATAKIRFIGK